MKNSVLQYGKNACFNSELNQKHLLSSAISIHQVSNAENQAESFSSNIL